MPATAEPPPAPVKEGTQIASQLKATTDAALKKVEAGGFDAPDFDTELQAAMDKDAGKQPVTTPVVIPPAAASAPAAASVTPDKPKVEAKVATIDNIPAELLGGKKKEAVAEPVVQTEEDRQKFLAEQTKDMSPKAAERFKSIENRAHEAEVRAASIEKQQKQSEEAFKKQLSEAQTKAAQVVDNSEVERLKKQVDEMDAVISKSALQDHPKFKAHYDVPISEAITGAKTLVTAEVSEEVESLLAMPQSKKRNERLIEIGGTLDDIKRAEFFDYVKDVNKLSASKAKDLTNWKQNKVHLEADGVKKQEIDQKQLEEMATVAWSKGMDKLTDPETGMFVFRKAEGSDEWNSRVDQRIIATKAILSNRSIPPEQLVEIAAKSVAADELQGLFIRQRLLVAKLQEEIENLKGAQPNPADGGGGGGGGLPDKDDFITATEKALVGSGLLR